MGNLFYKNNIETAPLHSYLGWSLYHHQLHRWFQFFPREQFIFIKFEDLNHKNRIQEVMNQITDHIGLPSNNVINKDGLVPISNINPKGKSERMNRDTILALKDFFGPHNKALYKMIGRDMHWEQEIDDFIAKKKTQ